MDISRNKHSSLVQKIFELKVDICAKITVTSHSPKTVVSNDEASLNRLIIAVALYVAITGRILWAANVSGQRNTISFLK